MADLPKLLLINIQLTNTVVRNSSTVSIYFTYFSGFASSIPIHSENR
jgi:hypothetical protein